MTTGNSSAILGNPLGQTPTAIINHYSTTGWVVVPTATDVNSFNFGGVKASLSGAMTVATLKTILTITGAGVIDFMAITPVDATSRTLRMKLTLDGVVVFDSTSAALTAANQGGFVTGSGVSGAQAISQQIPFSISCLFEVASSITETDKFNVFLKYRTN